MRNMVNEKVIKRCVELIFEKRFNYNYNKISAPIEVTGKLKNRFGYVKYNSNTQQVIKIVFNKNLTEDVYSLKTIESVIIHESLHAFLMSTGKPFMDSDEYFIKKAVEYGASLTRTIPKISGYFLYCSHCGKQVGVKSSEKIAERYLNPKAYRSICCKAHLISKGYETKKDTNKFDHSEAGKLIMQAIKEVYEEEKVVAEEAKIKPRLVNDNILIDENTKLLMSKNGKLSINQTTLWRSINYYCEMNDAETLKMLKANYGEIFDKGYNCITKAKKSKVDKLLK